jgi:hypothetical protein
MSKIALELANRVGRIDRGLARSDGVVYVYFSPHPNPLPQGERETGQTT